MNITSILSSTLGSPLVSPPTLTPGTGQDATPFFLSLCYLFLVRPFPLFFSRVTGSHTESADLFLDFLPPLPFPFRGVARCCCPPLFSFFHMPAEADVFLSPAMTSFVRSFEVPPLIFIFTPVAPPFYLFIALSPLSALRYAAFTSSSSLLVVICKPRSFSKFSMS